MIRRLFNWLFRRKRRIVGFKIIPVVAIYCDKRRIRIDIT